MRCVDDPFRCGLIRFFLRTGISVLGKSMARSD